MLEYNVKLDAFEGPLDLLLHLINRLEIDIYDIPMSTLTEQYVEYVKTMQELELDVASEYLVMAATLLAIKSKMLLPQHEEEWEDDVLFEIEEDPRDELVERLIEYRKYKEAAVELKQREEERSLIYTKPPTDLSEYVDPNRVAPLEKGVTVYDMLGAFHKLLRRKKIQKPKTSTITKQEIPIEKRMEEILGELKRVKGKKSFSSLFPYEQKDHIVVTFLALLELMKQQEIKVEQATNFDELFLYSVN
ncbi:segregation/condensation protein A [Mangrovibacillus cuniculi]|uniref:Segregation and condensation protein A n=1 Tax=Mangrovibacillus cuniculi TaxID=2593652 RepID=A0A7S8HHD4_9BACI|nr:segregation/condensation protein A [Mangrovibacillus cuniculi]QPC48395.1 segregation/condensation protein A [Mangrovibacillus cuniculi]